MKESGQRCWPDHRYHETTVSKLGRALNDLLRTTGIGGRIVLTAGVGA